jgi:DNA-binding transcriptional MerR regulator
VRAEEIPDKFFFKIGEVAKLTDLPAHVLRYWETEFPSLQPKKHGNGQRLYRRKDIELVLEIRDLLYGQKFTIAGAREELKRRRYNKALDRQVPDHWQLLNNLRRDVRELLEILE